MLKNNQTSTNITYQTPHGLLDFSTPLVMGILNITPDSFYSNSRVQNEKELLKKVELMVKEGVDILDIGGASTRPGAEEPEENEELNRVIRSLKIIRREFSKIPISIDTYRSRIALAAYNEGADLINDISGGYFDTNMIELISKIDIPYIIMHLKGNRQSMHLQYSYHDIVAEVLNYFVEKITKLNEAGVTKIIIDPGFGFSKQLEDNYKLLGGLKTLKKRIKYPILVGISRKRMIQMVVGSDADHALNGTTAAHVIAIINGASILRVHDVKEAKEAIKITQFFLSLNNFSDIPKKV